MLILDDVVEPPPIHECRDLSHEDQLPVQLVAECYIIVSGDDQPINYCTMATSEPTKHVKTLNRVEDAKAVYGRRLVWTVTWNLPNNGGHKIL